MFKLFSGYIPLFCLVYQLVCENVFLNVIDARASSIERVGNALLTPVHYVLNARVVDGERVRSRFSYVGPCALPMTGAVIALPASLVLGSVVKGLAYLSQGVRERHRALRALLWEEIPLHEPFCVAEAERYLEWPRKDEVYLPVQRGLLERIERLLGAYQIPFWVDAGSCLGVYRHNGVIPWDDDIDIAILQEDYLSVLKVLKRLGGDVWVQDWSGRDKPRSCT